MGPKSTLSTADRLMILARMAAAPLDLLVIGGGITGAGIAWDAALRGLKVGLVERRDFAYGTSSRSTKLIHGGLRYLKQGEIQLVREVGRERDILHRLAPHVVHPLAMLLPLYHHGTFGRFSTSIGLRLYDFLAGVRPQERRKMLGARAALTAEPLLKSDDLLGAGLYFEYITDDARLTIDVLKTACLYGATAVNYAVADDFLYENDRVVGALVRDVTTEQIFRIRARAVVNAGGPWADLVRAKDASIHGKRLHLTKGVHIVVPHNRLPIRQSVYFDVPDGRMIFAIPRGEVTYIGTTDTNYGNPDQEPATDIGDRDYLLSAVANVFPSAGLGPADVISSWAGLRPLIHQEGRGPSELSRRDEVFVSDHGLITIAGGKLTGFRKMAERVVDLVMEGFSRTDASTVQKACVTDTCPIIGGGNLDPDRYEEACTEWRAIGLEMGLSEADVDDIIRRYGSDCLQVFDLAKSLSSARANAPSDDQGNPRRTLALYAALQYSYEHEMAFSPSDFLVRRSGYLYFAPVRYAEIMEETIAWYAEIHGWDDEQCAHERTYLTELLRIARVSPMDSSSVPATSDANS